MARAVFIVNVDWFFDSHRRPLQKLLNKEHEIEVIAGNSGLITDYKMSRFEVYSRIPTLRGLYQLYGHVKKLEKSDILIVVTPLMIFLCHVLFLRRRNIIYNFSGLGFLRSQPMIIRHLFLKLLKFSPRRYERIFVVQNSDDSKYLSTVFKGSRNAIIKLIPGSGYEESEYRCRNIKTEGVVIGYVGRIRKDKGVLDLLKAISIVQSEGLNISVKIWGKLDDSSRHGFTPRELTELYKFNNCMCGFSEDKIKIFNSFNWFCLASNGEGLSKAAIEASSFGLPLLLSDVEGNRDMVMGNGFLFDYGDVNSITNALRKVTNLSKSETEIMSKKSRQMFEKYWTLKSIYGRWNELLKRYDTTSF